MFAHLGVVSVEDLLVGDVSVDGRGRTVRLLHAAHNAVQDLTNHLLRLLQPQLRLAIQANRG